MFPGRTYASVASKAYELRKRPYHKKFKKVNISSSEQKGEDNSLSYVERFINTEVEKRTQNIVQNLFVKIFNVFPDEVKDRLRNTIE